MKLFLWAPWGCSTTITAQSSSKTSRPSTMSAHPPPILPKRLEIATITYSNHHAYMAQSSLLASISPATKSKTTVVETTCIKLGE